MSDPTDHVERPGRTRWPALAVVLAVAVGGIAVLLVNRHKAAPADPAAAAAVEALVVHDGDTVEASGAVVSVPGRPARFCAPAPVAVGGGGDPADCSFSVPVTGVDLDNLTYVLGKDSGQPGTAHLVGVWRSGTLTVTRQSPPTPEDPETVTSGTSPCPTPPGGWRKDTDPGLALYEYVEQQHPEQFRPLRMAYAGGLPIQVVEVVEGDVSQARNELEQRYTGNLCVVADPGRTSIADQQQLAGTVGKAVGRLMNDQANGIYLIENDDTVRPQLTVLTPELFDKFADIGFTALDPHPWLRPVTT